MFIASVGAERALTQAKEVRPLCLPCAAITPSSPPGFYFNFILPLTLALRGSALYFIYLFRALERGSGEIWDRAAFGCCCYVLKCDVMLLKCCTTASLRYTAVEGK